MGKRRGAPVCGSVKLSQNYKIASGLPRYAYRYDPRNDVVHSKPLEGAVLLNYHKIARLLRGLPRYAYRYDPRNDVVHSKPLEGAELLNYHKIARLLRYARNDGCYARKDATNYVTGKGRRCV